MSPGLAAALYDFASVPDNRITFRSERLKIAAAVCFGSLASVSLRPARLLHSQLRTYAASQRIDATGQLRTHALQKEADAFYLLAKMM
jgi:hypothetical protein